MPVVSIVPQCFFYQAKIGAEAEPAFFIARKISASTFFKLIGVFVLPWIYCRRRKNSFRNKKINKIQNGKARDRNPNINPNVWGIMGKKNSFCRLQQFHKL